jgi:hypothetical protein
MERAGCASMMVPLLRSFQTLLSASLRVRPVMIGWPFCQTWKYRFPIRFKLTPFVVPG